MSVKVWTQRCSAWYVWGCAAVDDVAYYGIYSCNGSVNSCYTPWYWYTGTSNNHYRAKVQYYWNGVSQGSLYSGFIDT